MVKPAEKALNERAKEIGLTVSGYGYDHDYQSLYNLWFSLGLIRRPQGNQEEDLKRIAQINGGAESLLLVLKDAAGEIQACAFALYNGYSATLHHLGTSPTYAGKGLAGLLMDVLHERIKARGAVYIDLIVRDGNPALNLYLKKGYTIETTGKGKISMLKTLY